MHFSALLGLLPFLTPVANIVEIALGFFNGFYRTVVMHLLHCGGELDREWAVVICGAETSLGRANL